MFVSTKCRVDQQHIYQIIFNKLLFLSFFSRLLTSVPLITDNALNILKRYCSDEEKTNFGMNILYNLIIYRIPIREKCLDILINLIQNENNFIRNNAIDIMKNLYEKNQFKQLIEVKFCFANYVEFYSKIVLCLGICFKSFTDVGSWFWW